MFSLGPNILKKHVCQTIQIQIIYKDYSKKQNLDSA